MAAKRDVARSERSINDLKRQLDEARQHQVATSELLEVIRLSGSDFQGVLDALLTAAARLCGVEAGGVAIREGEVFRYLATIGMNAEFNTVMRGRTYQPKRGTTFGRAALEKRVIHIVDVLADPDYDMPETSTIGRIRTWLCVPMMRDGEVVGTITLTRTQVEPFTDQHIALIKTFADQAVIAMENARLLTEQREALEQLTATAEVLAVINSLPGNLAPVFETILEKAMHLCEAAFGILWMVDGNQLAQRGVPPAYADYLAKHPVITREAWAASGTITGRILHGEPLVHVEDLADDPPYRAGNPYRRALVDLGGARTALVAPLRKDASVFGFIMIYRQEVRLFSDRQAALLQNFAAQAVIAMENARLLTEQREALDRQTATADILRVISGSPADAQPTFEAIAVSAARLCDAEFSAVARFEDGLLHLAATNNLSADEAAAFHSLFPRPALRNFAIGRAFVDGCVVQFDDVLAQPDYDQRTRDVLQAALGYRTFMAVPILRSGKPIGAVGCARRQVKPFSAEQIQMLNTFAEQASIALDNVRLFTDLRQRTDDLTESLEYQIATSDVLKVISRSTF
jgi:GAF domain-containing protein